MTVIEPNGPTQAYDTYGLVSPRSTHTRAARCEEHVGPCNQTDEGGNRTCDEWHCGAWAHGWRTLCDVGTEIGQQRARYIIDESERHWTAMQFGGMVTFTFPPGQQCFTEHRIALDREPLFTLKRGDYRTYARPRVVAGDEWLDRFAMNQIKLKEVHDRG